MSGESVATRRRVGIQQRHTVYRKLTHKRAPDESQQEPSPDCPGVSRSQPRPHLKYSWLLNQDEQAVDQERYEPRLADDVQSRHVLGSFGAAQRGIGLADGPCAQCSQ